MGNAPTKKVKHYGEVDKNITVLGRIPDIRTAFKQAHVLVAPVFSGKGTRYKILEAMASGTPVVASKIAVEGLDVKLGIHLLASNSAKTMAELVAKLLNNEKLWKKLSVNGRQFVQQNFDWQSISEKLDMIYKTLGKKGEIYDKKS